MISNLKSQTRVTVDELAERVKKQAEGIDAQVDDALFQQSAMRRLRIMCRAKLDGAEDFDAVEELAAMHGFLTEGEELQRPETAAAAEEEAA